MNFISMFDALEGIAFPTWSSADRLASTRPDEFTDRVSQAASRLFGLLHNHPNPPRWVAVNNATRQPIYNDSAGAEGFAVLEMAAAASRNRQEDNVRHALHCQSEGLDPHSTTCDYRAESFAFPSFDNAQSIGFERTALADFLFANNVPSKIAPSEAHEYLPVDSDQNISMVAAFIANDVWPADSGLRAHADAIGKGIKVSSTANALFVMRLRATIQIQGALEALLLAGDLPLYRSSEIQTYIPTTDREGAFISVSEANELVRLEISKADTREDQRSATQRHATPLPAPAQETAAPAPTPLLVAASVEPEKAAPKLTKAALIAQHKHEWTTIERDIKDASGNGLAKAARAGARTWYEDAAMKWARSKNKLIQTANAASLNSVMSNLPTTTHRLKG